jgi:beta-phosphoglucomutase-like phosphatase (HAD superfamily)
VPPGRCLIVEDSPAGVMAGKAAGALVCGIPGTTTEERLLAAGADLVIHHLEDLRSL